MRKPNDESDARPLRVGSLFSGYGGLDIAVEEVFNARTIWFSEINEPVARIFAHHWPDAPNLGDITTIDWGRVEPVDVLCGGFPCRTCPRLGRWPALHPAPAPASGRTWRPPSRRCNPNGSSSRTCADCSPHPRSARLRKDTRMNDATPPLQPPQVPPFAVWNPTRGVRETSQPDLYGHLAPYSETWPTSGGETLAQVRVRRGTVALLHQVIDLALHGPDGSANQNDESETLWSLIEDIFTAGDATPQPSRDGNTSPGDLPLSQPS